MDNLPPPPPPLTTTMDTLPPPPPFTTTINLPPPPPSTASNNLPPPAQPIIMTKLPPPPPIHNSPLPSPTLSTTLDHLTSLLQLTTATLTSLPCTLPTPITLPCPHDPGHLISPSSLFSHYLNCPSTVEIPPATSFFYQNCPSAVTLRSNHPSPQTPTLALPPALLNECCDASSNQRNPSTNRDASRERFFLPSEIWLLRGELESWGFGGHAPISCSYSVLRAFVRLRRSGLSSLREWIIGRSLKYGVVIDFALADRIVVLVGLCLKALVRYALGLMSKAEVKIQLNPSFECPVLGEVLKWLGSQLAVLYGEVSGRSFAIDAIRECVLESASRSCLFPLDGKCESSSEIKEVVSDVDEHRKSVVPINEVGKDVEDIGNGETIEENRIFVSQVEEAVTKLHERSVMEEHIKALRGSQLLNAYQRYMEHEHVSKIAEEERKRRPDYKPIIEHDGLFWQRLNETDHGKTKTREELLAEERDYKRRRMSYRGKKSKRNPLEVTRDIIEEYMEAIKIAGGISGSHTTMEKTEALVPENLQIQIADDRFALTKRSENENSRQTHYPRKGSFSRHDSIEHYKGRSRDVRSEHGHEYSNRNVKRVSEEQNYRRRYTDEHKPECSSDNKRYRDEHERKREHNDHKRYSDDEDSTHRKRERYKEDQEYECDRNRRKSSSRHKPHMFEDRYDPADSENFYEDLD